MNRDNGLVNGVRPVPFKCPMGLSNEDAICRTCDNAKPAMVNSIVWHDDVMTNVFWLEFSDGKMSSIIEASEEKRDGIYEALVSGRGSCLEWRKKYVSFACGCGGSLNCECGYHTMFCLCAIHGRMFSFAICPFCGRQCDIHSSEISSLDFSLDDLS